MRRKFIQSILLLFTASAQGRAHAAAFELRPASVLNKPSSSSFYLIIFATKNCPWCAILKRDYLVHLPVTRDGVTIQMLEVQIDRDLPLIDFKGLSTSHKRFAKDLGVRVSPTVMAFSSNGTRLGEPLVGVGIPDFYGAYLDGLIQFGIQNQRAQASI